MREMKWSKSARPPTSDNRRGCRVTTYWERQLRSGAIAVSATRYATDMVLLERPNDVKYDGPGRIRLRSTIPGRRGEETTDS